MQRFRIIILDHETFDAGANKLARRNPDWPRLSHGREFSSASEGIGMIHEDR